MVDTAKTLYILRHAKSAWDSDAQDDFSRPLNTRGRRDALAMGKWMMRENFFPDQIVSSPALRAWQTVTSVCHALQIDLATIDFDKHLYLAGMTELCNVLSNTEKGVNSVLLVGHNPGLEQLIQHLLNSDPRDIAGDKLLPTAAFCILKIGNWDDIESGSAELVMIMKPKLLN